MENPIFENNPSLDCYFETSDGNCFFTEHAAQSHAHDLKNKQVKAVYKTEATPEEVIAPEEVITPEEVIATEFKKPTLKK
jgi:hypothetical protein